MWVPFSPFVPSVYHPCFLLCIDQICVDWVHFFCFVFAFCKICKNWPHFFVRFPSYLLLCPPRFRFLAFEWNGSARSPVSSVRSLSTMGAFSDGLTSTPQPSHTEDFSPRTLTLPLWSFPALLCLSLSPVWSMFTLLAWIYTDPG